MSRDPEIRRIGVSGVVVTFGDTLSEQANLAAIAFRAAVDAQAWGEVQETSSSLVSTFLSVDLTAISYDEIHSRLSALLATRDWFAASLPPGRKLWTLPMCFDEQVAPQLKEAAEAAAVSPKEALEQLSQSRTRVITLGFAPGQPYLGLLPKQWDIPRQTELTPNVPVGALVVAIRQFVIFAATTPTGWRHVGQTAFRPFDPDRDPPFAFSPGDEVRFATITASELEQLEKGDSLGGAEWALLA